MIKKYYRCHIGSTEKSEQIGTIDLDGLEFDILCYIANSKNWKLASDNIANDHNCHSKFWIDIDNPTIVEIDHPRLIDEELVATYDNDDYCI